MNVLNKKSLNNFNNLDILDKLSILEKLVVNNITQQSSKNQLTLAKGNTINSIRLLLDIMKLKHKISSMNQESNILDLFNATYVHTQNMMK